MICYRHCAIMMAVLVFLFTGLGWAINVSPKDDAYQYMSNRIDDQLYNEWWYFDVTDNDTQFMVVYLLNDPENITSAQKIQVQAVAMQDGLPPVIGKHKSRGYGGDRNSPMFEIDKSGFSPEQEQNLRVWGEVKDIVTGEPIHWDLVYEPTASPWFAIPVRTPIGHIKGDWMKWLVYMPSAQVTGTLTIGNMTKSLQGTGYHEHAWGRFALSDPQITRASVSVPQDNFSLSFAEILGEGRVAFVGIEKDGKSIAFKDRQIKLNDSDYSFDNKTGSIFPRAYHVTADNGDYSLDLAVDAKKSVVTTLDYQPPLLSVLFYNQVSILQGTLKSKSGEQYTFREQGFCGFTAPRLHPIFGRINSSSTNYSLTNSLSSKIIINGQNERTGQQKLANLASDGFYSF